MIIENFFSYMFFMRERVLLFSKIVSVYTNHYKFVQDMIILFS